MARPNGSHVADVILVIVNEQGVIQGVGALADAIPCNDPSWVREQLRRLQANGQLSYLPSKGGRGHRSVIRKRNRNSPGQPRKNRS